MIHLPSGTGKGGCDFIVLLRMAYDVNCRDYLFQELVIQHFQIAVDHRSLRFWTDSRTSENGELSLEEIKQQVQDSRSSQFSSLCLHYKVLCKAGSHSVHWPRTPHSSPSFTFWRLWPPAWAARLFLYALNQANATSHFPSSTQASHLRKEWRLHRRTSNQTCLCKPQAIHVADTYSLQANSQRFQDSYFRSCSQPVMTWDRKRIHLQTSVFLDGNWGERCFLYH